MTRFDDCSPLPLHFVIATPNRRPDQCYGRRRVRNYELEYVSRGEGEVEVDGRRLPARDHALLLRRPGELAQGRGIYHSRFIEFAGNPNHCRSHGLDGLPDVAFPRDWWVTEALFNELFDAPRSDGLGFKIRLFRLLGQMYGGAAVPADRCEAERVILDSRRYMQAHFSEPLCAEALARHAGYSVCHYAHLFKRITGETPLSCLQRLRVEQARALLLRTALSAEAVMRECGFQSYPNFLRVFREQCGLTPTQYRKENAL